jgi:hypothetical protein
VDRSVSGSPVEEPEVTRVPHGAPAPSHGVAPPSRPRVPLPKGRRAIAFAIAALADLLQWVLFPLFIAGGAAPWVDGLDVGVGVTLILLLGWHWAFLPTFIVELFPVADLVPTWTLAVWIATRGKRE